MMNQPQSTANDLLSHTDYLASLPILEGFSLDHDALTLAGRLPDGVPFLATMPRPCRLFQQLKQFEENEPTVLHFLHPTRQIALIVEPTSKGQVLLGQIPDRAIV